MAGSMVVPVSAGRVDTAVVAASVIHGALVLILAYSLVLRHHAVTGSTPYRYLFYFLVRGSSTHLSCLLASWSSTPYSTHLFYLLVRGSSTPYSTHLSCLLASWSSTPYRYLFHLLVREQYTI